MGHGSQLSRGSLPRRVPGSSRRALGGWLWLNTRVHEAGSERHELPLPGGVRERAGGPVRDEAEGRRVRQALWMVCSPGSKIEGK